MILSRRQNDRAWDAFTLHLNFKYAQFRFLDNAKSKNCNILMLVMREKKECILNRKLKKNVFWWRCMSFDGTQTLKVCVQGCFIHKLWHWCTFRRENMTNAFWCLAAIFTILHSASCYLFPYVIVNLKTFVCRTSFIHFLFAFL